MKRFFIFLGILIVLAAVAGAFTYQQYQAFLEKPVILAGENNTFNIESGSSIRTVARQLAEKNILPESGIPYVKPEWLFRAHARVTKQASKIKAGEYPLEAGMAADDLLKRFTSGKTIQYQIGFIEGRSYKDIFNSVKSHPDLVQTLTDDDYANIMTKLGAPEGTHPEGWFFPDTYNFPKGTTDLAVLQRSYDTMVDTLAKAWDSREVNPHLKTPYDALILASIVEKETGVPDERPLIAQVFLSRLDKGMLLQTDPTVIYGMGDSYQGNIRKKDLRKDTPYNTYTRKGLPPTPISTVGKAALDAVFNPEATESLYFVATGLGDGRHYFSRNYKEHRRAVIKYQLNGKKSRYQGDK
uniref:Endolytic murein transglycosylase n=1 Tax=uncultured Thiotrichaceae bacterium TaxID=298394 RepID=A0A6S6TI44_9GAMM|nr:MAG: FIG004453: protein YceG like [uncultured Thiotrichaceae bacterium]